jgi:alpha-1,2-mannosyltransferase
LAPPGSAFPAVFINVGHGHNGFLTAALFGTALLVLYARPIIAGILIGLLAYKPQFGLLIPLVLIVGGRWRTLAAAAVTVVLLIAVTTQAFGVDVWNAFLASTRFTRTIVLENRETGRHKIQSVFAWARMWGASVALAYTVQAIASVAVAAALVWLWHIRAAFPLQAAALMIGAILATPYSLDYDLMLLALAIAFLLVHCSDRGFLSYEKTALAALWLVPLVARPIGQATLIPLAVPAMLLVFALILRRAARVVPVDEGEEDPAANVLRIAP